MVVINITVDKELVLLEETPQVIMVMLVALTAG